MKFRLPLLLIGTFVAMPVLAWLAIAAVAGHARAAIRAAISSRGREALTFLELHEVLVALCAVGLLLAGAAWCWGLLLALAELAGGAPARWAAALPSPGLVRGLVLGCLGVSLVVGSPASAAPQDVGSAGSVRGTGPTLSARALAGLALPERRATGSPTVSTSRHLVVRPGDSLWSLAAQRLGPDAADAAIDRAWRRIAAANPGIAGHPHLIFPGTVLRVPPLDDPLRKDPP